MGSLFGTVAAECPAVPAKPVRRSIRQAHRPRAAPASRFHRTFPRFYFLSNDDLLDILSQIKNPAAIQPHLLKMFDNIKKLEFGSNAVDVQAMISAEGENIPLAKYPKARGEVSRPAERVRTVRHGGSARGLFLGRRCLFLLL